MKIDGKISGAVFRHVKVQSGPAYTAREGDVIEITLKSSADSYSSNVFVLSKEAAQTLARSLQLHSALI